MGDSDITSHGLSESSQAINQKNSSLSPPTTQYVRTYIAANSI